MTQDYARVPIVLQQALRMARLKHIPAGQIVYYEGDEPTELFVLKSGVIKLYDIDEQGNEKILHIVKPPALIPFAFFSGLTAPLRWFYATLTDCEVYVFMAQDMLKLTRADSALAEVLTHAFSSDVHELLARLSSLGKTNARDKILAALNFLVASHTTDGRGEWCRVDFPVSHQLIADLCGITRETAAITMKELQGEKIIGNPKLTVLEIHKKRLAECAEAG